MSVLPSYLEKRIKNKYLLEPARLTSKAVSIILLNLQLKEYYDVKYMYIAKMPEITFRLNERFSVQPGSKNKKEI